MATAVQTSIRGLVARICERLGARFADVVTEVPERPGKDMAYQLDYSKIRTELGWEPTVSFEDGVGEMLRRIDYWREAPVWDPASIERATKTWFTMLSGERT